MIPRQKKVVIVDTSWLYNTDFDYYKDVFDIIPRESLLTYLLYIPDIPAYDETFSDYFTVLYKLKYNTTEGLDFMLSERVSRAQDLIYDYLVKFLPPYIVEEGPAMVTWSDSSSIVVADLCLANTLRYYSKANNEDFLRYFKNDRDNVVALSILFNLDYWNKLL